MDEKTRRLVERAERRAKKATKGPWIVWKGHAEVYQGPAKENELYSMRGHGQKICECDDFDHSKTQAKRDASFVARARTDVPALCAAVRRLDEDVDRLTVMLRAWREYDSARFEYDRLADDPEKDLQAAKVRVESAYEALAQLGGFGRSSPASARS